jgi:hypothetical protein
MIDTDSIWYMILVLYQYFLSKLGFLGILNG